MTTNTMTLRHQSLTIVVLAAMLTSVLAGAATANIQNASGAEQAQLAVEQPHYIDSRVQTTSEDGDRIYQVQGEEIELQPTNFDSGDVVGFGSSTEGGQDRKSVV